MKGLQDMARGPQGPAQQQGSALSPAEELDADIAFGVMANLLYGEGGSRIVMDALGAENPAPALASMLAGIMDKVDKQLGQRGVNLSPNVWMAEGGAVDRAVDAISDIGAMAGMEVSPQLESMVMAEMVDQLKMMRQGMGQGQPQGTPQDMAAAAPPQGGPPPMMGGGV